MSEIAYFDPADIMVWFDLEVLMSRFDLKSQGALVPDHARDAAFNIVRQAFNTHEGISKDVVNVIDAYGHGAIVALLVLWHEQRHFVDHLLTNFGASRMRSLWQIRAQLSNFYEAAIKDGVLGVPIDIYADPIECESLGLGKVEQQSASGVAAVLADRRNQLARDRREGKLSGEAIPIDGFCQLEALGSWAQLAGTTSFLVDQTFKHAGSFEQPFTQYPYLEAVVSFMERCGFRVVSSPGNSFSIMNTHLMVPLLIASLMCRRSGFAGQSAISGSLPARRFFQIVSKLKEEGIRDVPSADDGFEVIEKTCEKVWGRTMLNDLDEDIDFEFNQAAKFRGAVSSEDIAFLEQWTAARREVRLTLASTPGHFCDSWLYSTKAIPSIRPKVILAARSGQFWTIGGDPPGIRTLFGVQTGGGPLKSTTCYYGDLKKSDEGLVGKVRFDDDHWLDGFHKSRHIRLLTEGRRQAFGTELDSFVAERELSQMGIELRFRTGFEYTDPSRSAKWMFELAGKETLACEISGREVTAATAIQLCPWDFQRYPKLRDVLSANKKLGICPTDGSYDADDQSLGNWTWWLVHGEYAALLDE